MPRTLLTLLGLLALGAQEPAPTDVARRPNVLVVVTDDQSVFDLPIYEPDSPLVAPTLARLAAEGMTLDRAYHMGSWSGAVCMPSRHMILSGRTLWHLPRNGVRGVERNPLCPEDLAEHSLAAVFRDAGYATMRTCKLGNSYEAGNAQFEVRRDATKRGASDEEGSAWHAQQVLDWLGEREAARDERPFLVYLGFSHPHDPRWGKDEHLARYGAVNEGELAEPDPRAPPLPPNWLAAHPFRHGHDDVRDEVAVQGVGERRDEACVRNELGRQLACSQEIDVQLGRVLAALEARGELDDTYVVYTADHGIAIGRHGLMGKQNLYEPTWRVPLVVRGPGIAPGARAPGDVYLLDLLATLCELTGVAAPPTNEGTSFAPVLRGERASVRDVLYGAYSGGSRPGIRAVRQGDWKLVEYAAYDGELRETQLFDLARNPHELLPEHAAGEFETDLAEDPRFAERLAELRALLRSEMQRLDDPFPIELR